MSKQRAAIFLRDDDGERVGHGDRVIFNYGIPPVVVVGQVVRRGKSLIVLTPGHRPRECNLRTLRKHVGGWRKYNG